MTTTTGIEHVNGTDRTPQQDEAELASYAVAAARAEAIRIEAEAKAQAEIERAKGEAEAARIKAAEEAREAAIRNDRAEVRARRERATEEARIAEAQAKRDAAERATRKAREADEAEEAAVAAQTKETEGAEKRWRRTAKAFYALCGAVALPVQMSAFWDPERVYMVLAPVLIEIAALVVLIGAAAAVTAGRPHWHYRLIAWCAAFVAAGINLAHGLAEFDTATAIGTALASVAGPGVWDLHEHGRIRKKEGRETRRERKRREKEAKRRADEEAVKRAEQEAKEEADQRAAEEEAKTLADQRSALYPDVWEHAVRLAAALGETTVTEAVWKQAHQDVKGAAPGEDAETIGMRKKAEHRVESARSGAPVSKVARATNAQRASQMPTPRRSVSTPLRRGLVCGAPGDSARFSAAARSAMSETAKKATAKKGSDQ